MSDPKKWLVLGGCPRSGTTLLNLLLNSHPQLLLTNEVCMVKLVQQIERLYYREQALKTIMTRAKSDKETWDTSEIQAIVPQLNKTGVNVLEALYNFDPDKVGAHWYGDKYPKYYIENYTSVSELLGEVHFIHVSRNPLNVINSMMRRMLNTRADKDYWTLTASVEDCLNEWIAAWNHICSKVSHPNYLHLKYEQLLDSQSEVTEQLRHFLDLASDQFDTALINNKDDDLIYITEQDQGIIQSTLGHIIDDWHLPIAEIVERHGPVQPVTLKLLDNLKKKVQRLRAYLSRLYLSIVKEL